MAISGRRLFRLTALPASCALLALSAPSSNAATLTGSYGVLGVRTVHVTPTYSGVSGKRLRIVLETKKPGKHRKIRVRASRPLRSGGGRLRWTYPRGLKQLTVRVRITSQAKKRKGKHKAKVRTVVSGPWKTLGLGGIKPGRPLASVGARSVVSAPAPGTPGTLVLTGSQRIKVGDAIALPVTPATPQGLLAKATAVTKLNGQTQVSTEPATLPEIIPVGELELAIPADPPATGRAASPFQRLSKALTCTNDRTATAHGEASLSAGLSLKTAWKRTGGFFSIPKLTATFQGDVRATVNAGASISGEATCSMERTPLFVNPIRLATITTSIGPVPVVATVDGQIYLSGDATASGKIETSMTATAGATAGVNYDGNGFKPFGRLDKSLNLLPPTVTASGSVQAALAPAVDVRLYGVAGPQIDFSAGLKAAADINPGPGEPWWKITAPLSLGVQFQLKAWKLDLQSDRFTIWQEEPELARATTPPGGSSITDNGPSPDPLPPGIRTRLVWDSNSDVDLHTWDIGGDHAYFRDLNGIDSGYLDQDVIPGYGPETFQETDPGHTFTFGVCQFNGNQANVTVDVRDPDGQTRRFTVTLRGRKAAALLTVSPNGQPGFIPDDAWCDFSGQDPTQLGQTTTGSFQTARSRPTGPKVDGSR